MSGGYTGGRTCSQVFFLEFDCHFIHSCLAEVAFWLRSMIIVQSIFGLNRVSWNFWSPGYKTEWIIAKTSPTLPRGLVKLTQYTPVAFCHSLLGFSVPDSWLHLALSLPKAPRDDGQTQTDPTSRLCIRKTRKVSLFIRNHLSGQNISKCFCHFLGP